jgi:hypothetical protein
MTKHYLLIVMGDVEPDLRGPFPSTEVRDQEAKDHRSQDPEMEDGLYPLDIDDHGNPEVGSYCSSDLEPEEAAAEPGGAP